MLKRITYKEIGLILLIIGLGGMLFYAQNVLADTATGEVTIGNSLPVTSLTSLNSDADISTLIPGSSVDIVCTALVTDNEGCSDIDSVEGVIYRTAVTSSCVAEASHCYTGVINTEAVTCAIDSGANACSGGSDLDATYTCTASIRFNADPTSVGSAFQADTWTCDIRGVDGGGNGSYDSSSTVEMNELNAINILEVTIQYNGGADINLGDCSTSGGACTITAMTDNFTVENYGNTEIDFNIVSGTDGNADDGLSCDIGSIPSSNMVWALTGVAFDALSATIFSNNYAQVDSALLIQAVDEDTSQQPLYTGMKVGSSGNGGFCDGVITVQLTTPV